MNTNEQTADAPTPETDAETYSRLVDNDEDPLTYEHYVEADFARRLERERNQWKESCFKADEICLEVMRERDEARAELAKLKTTTPTPLPVCEYWVGEGFVDSGGGTPLGEGINTPYKYLKMRERDEARAELAKVKAKALPESACFFLKAILDASHAGCLNNCLHCGEVNELAYQEARDAAIDQHYAGYNAAVESPPPDGSAVEWVRELLYTADGRNRVLDEDDAIELARRCDEAEVRCKNFEHGYHIHSARADEVERKRGSDIKTMEWITAQWRKAEDERDAAIKFIKELNATKEQHGRQYRSRCGRFLAIINQNKQ